MKKITGTIIDIRFHKNGYLIARLKDGTTIKGNMQTVQFGLEYSFEGKWQVHPTYGKSFAFTSYLTAYPKDLNAIRHYLMENAKWVGPEISKALVNTYGERTLEICKADPVRVSSEIKGITQERAKEISDMLKKNEADEELQIQLKTLLDGMQVNNRVMTKIIELYGQDAVSKIKSNPYSLIEDIEGVGFLTADRIAIKNGYKKEGPERIKAGIYHVLKEESNVGHTCLPENLLIKKICDLLAIGASVAKSEITELAKQNMLVVIDNNDNTYIYIPYMYENESYIAGKLKALLEYKEEELQECV